MSDTGPLRSAAAPDRAARDAVVRPLARAAERPCVRPGCPSPARASLSFRYDSREAWLERLSEEPRPECYDLCGTHAARTRPPHGWQLRDRRPREEQVEAEPPPTPTHLGGEHTVAVLAAALRSVPDEPSASIAEPATPVDEPAVTDGGPIATAAEAAPVVDLAAAPTTGGSPSPEVAPPSPAADALTTDHGTGRPEDASTSPILGSSRPDPADDTAPPVRRPRPVPAARDRLGDEHERAPGGPAQLW